MAKPRRIDGIGAPVKRREDFRLLTGRGRYAEDWSTPGEVHAAFVRSPHAHADVVSIDAKPALGVEGVLGVFTGRDLIADGVGPIPTLIAERGGGIRSRDGSPFAEPTWHALAVDRVRYVGEAELHLGIPHNRAYDWECGDSEATARAIASAAHVTRLTVVDNRLVTCFMEPRAALAEWDPVQGRYILYASLQSVHQLAMNLARVLGVPAGA